MLENPAPGLQVRLADRTIGDQVIPGRGTDRVGKIEQLTRAVSGDGKREVFNCHVRFPAAAGADEIVEIHEAGALELAT